ncbi:MAG: 3-dehydroquinate synthase [Candidatus Omnitrophica bacterium ADurb.Bin314]|jgi:3-dehydroquinate synthase|nr:MAG: 3-dehydroquinate synthase [Candidatus Omnitrophica bacterium ADurb.Bin314]HOE68218.1 3-dehydroquinate synthase [Candidatus Omnitrophota bacterium]
MKTIPVKSIKGAYKIVVGKGILARSGSLLSGLFRPGARILVVSQTGISRYARTVAEAITRKGFKVSFHTLPDGERAKSGKELFRLLHVLLAKGFERKDGIVAVGGGVVSDLSGFAASVYLRGIRYVNVATTLLAQVDSSIGGKTGINLPEGKNLMGAFHPPALVISDVGVLDSLPAKELCASLAEVVKYGVIRDARLFRFLERNAGRILEKNAAALERIVTDSACIKAGVVSRDEYETKGERMILNYGHTFGHGIENAAKYRKIVHGEAIGIGMAMAAHLAAEIGICSPEFVRRQLALLKRLGLPVAVDNLKIRSATVLKAMMRDKKKAGGRLRFVLPERIGKVTIKTGISAGELRNILRLFGAR